MIESKIFLLTEIPKYITNNEKKMIKIKKECEFYSLLISFFLFCTSFRNCKKYKMLLIKGRISLFGHF